MMNIPLNIDWQQILLHLLNFTILAGGLYWLLYKPVKQFMAKREAHYQELEDVAEQKVKQAEELKTTYEEKLKQADEEIRRQKLEAQQSIQGSTQQQLEEAQSQAKKILSSAEEEAKRSREKALETSQKELQDLAIAVAEKLVLQSGKDAFDQFLDSVEKGEKV